MANTTANTPIDRASRMSGDRDSSMMRTPHTEELRDSVTEAGANLREAAAHAVPAAREQLSRVSDTVAQRKDSLEKDLIACIEEKPINSVLIACGIGVLLGMFLFRR